MGYDFSEETSAFLFICVLLKLLTVLKYEHFEVNWLRYETKNTFQISVDHIVLELLFVKFLILQMDL